MAGRRFFQRGHATVPSASLNTGSSLGIPRWMLGLALVAVSVTGGSYLFQRLSSGTGRSIASDAAAAPASAAAEASSLFGSALSKVQNASQAAVTAAAPTASSGLQTRSLGDEGTVASLTPRLAEAEARLLAVYRLISQGQHRQALARAEELVREYPTFHLAHLVYGDLLSIQMRPVRQLGDVPDTNATAAAQQLATLREESRRRILALTERPPEGTVPSQFVALAPSSRHAIAVDASKSRLYLFENESPAPAGSLLAPPPKFKLLGDFYISVGLLGIEKSAEGDKRTPLGVYYITSTLNPATLPDLYGIGALPINYPNPLDIQRGKTGGGIWLHGTPRDQFVRAPQASDGCVVLSNPDLQKLLSTVQIRTTPVVIAPELQWVQPAALDTERSAFEASLESWRKAKSEGRLDQLKDFYSVKGNGSQVWSRVESDLRALRSARGIELKDVSALRWKDSQDTMVVTFGEVMQGQAKGVTRRQYWAREHNQWKIFFEGTP